MLFNEHEYGKFQNKTNLLNRRISNLLSACRQYLDHSKHHISKILGSDKIKEIESYASYEYDSVLGYRVMESIRNYAQHRGLPIHRCDYNSKWVKKDEASILLFSVTPYIDIEILQKDKKFKKSILSELLDIDDKHDIRPFVREYIASFGSIHKKIRTLLRLHTTKWEETLNNAIEKFKEVAGEEGSILGLTALIHREGKDSSAIPIFLDIIKYRKELQDKNSNLGSLTVQFVDTGISEYVSTRL